MKKRVIVIGGGFAGINFIKSLDKNLFDVLLIDKLNHHQFQPLFYQVASSQIEPSSISFPLRHIFRNAHNVQIRLAEVLSIDSDNNFITTNIGDFSYDILVIAAGCKTNFFGNKSIEENALTLKSTYDAIEIRNHILQNFENVLSASEAEKEKLLNIVIVGAGPTGVELAGIFAEIKKNILPKDYHRIDFSKLNVFLIEGSENTLNSMSEKAKTASREYLENMGVKVITKVFVTNYDGHNLILSNGETIKTTNLIWAAGVTPNTFDGVDRDWLNKANRFIVDRNNKLIYSDNIYAIGDIAYMETPKYPHGHPQVANVAINQAKHLANNLNRSLKGQELIDYEYKDLGSMATIGRNKAVVDFPFAKFKGTIAWLVWMFLHLMLILSVRNKLIIFINWAWGYISKNTALRLILKDNKSMKDKIEVY